MNKVNIDVGFDMAILMVSVDKKTSSKTSKYLLLTYLLLKIMTVTFVKI